jgi:hypothetical protein
MTSDSSPTDRPWLVPVPVRRSEFVSLYPEHAELNVEVDLGQVGAYSGSHRPPEDRLWCDLQDNPDFSSRGRLGSGRAGVYRGKYLKGVGRTLLAGNWATEADLIHHTGHLRTSNAVRELLISTFLEAKGCAHAINPCEGLLVRPLAPALRGHIEVSLRDSPDFHPDRANPFLGDWKLQAISVKQGPFARFSNLIWASHHLDFFREKGPMTTNLRQFFVHFANAIDPGIAPGTLTPDGIAALFFQAIDRAIASLHCFWRMGLSWGSLHNNFAADGRYVDLEWPVLLGKPLVGVVGQERHQDLTLPHRHALWGLFEVLAFVMHHRMIVWDLAGRLRGISRMGHPVQPREREYSRAVADALRKRGRDHLLFSRRKLREMILGWVGAELDLSASQRGSLGSVFDTVYAAHLHGRRGNLTLEPADVTLPRIGFKAQGYPHVFPFMDKGPVMSEEAQFIHRVWLDLDRIGDPDRLLVRVGAAVDEIRSYCAPAENARGAAARRRPDCEAVHA